MMAETRDSDRPPVEQTTCPRCGARDSFIKGYLRDTCVCRVCQSQLGWREIPGCGPDCSARLIISAEAEDAAAGEAGADEAEAGADETDDRRPTDADE
jgi:hypothetical protein